MPVFTGSHTFVKPGDSADQSLCWLGKVFAAIREGEVPLWDFSTQAGVSFVGELQTSALYPVAWLFGVLVTPDLPRAMDLFLAAHFLIAALGMHVCARTLGLSHAASFISAAIFAYGSTFALRVNGQPNLFSSLAWLPWVVWAARRSVCSITLRETALYAMACGVFLALCLLAGHVHAVVLSVVVAGIFATDAAVRAPSIVEGIRRGGVWGVVSAVVAGGIALPQLIATREYMKLAYKWYGPAHTEYPHVVPFRVFEEGSLAFSDLATIFSSRAVGAIDGGTLFFTLTGLGLALFGVALQRRASAAAHPGTMPCLLTIAFALAFSFSAVWPLGHIFHNMPLVNLIRTPARSLFAFGFAASLLAGIGMDNVVRVAPRLRWPCWRKPGFPLRPETLVSPFLISLSVYELFMWLPARISSPTGSAGTGVATVLNDPIVHKLLELQGNGGPIHRYYGSREDIPPNAPNLFPLLSVHGYRSSRTKAFHDYFDFDPMSEKADALGIRWWISREPIQGLPLIFESGGRYLYERPDSPPVFWQAMHDGTKVSPEIARIEWKSNTVRAQFREPIQGRLVFGQIMYPGFKAYADGFAAEIEPYGELVSINVKTPTREIFIRYHPRWFNSSVIVALATSVMVTALWSLRAAITVAKLAARNSTIEHTKHWSNARRTPSLSQSQNNRL